MNWKRLIGLTVLLVAFAVLADCTTQDAQGPGHTYVIAYMNITPDWTQIKEEGFIQLYVAAANVSAFRVQSVKLAKVNAIRRLQPGEQYNGTFEFNEVNIADAITMGTHHENEKGFILSSDNPINVIGVKSDKGTTDSFMAIEMTWESKEYYIAAWKSYDDRFFAAFQILSVLPETCVEVYRIENENGTKKIKREQSLYMTKPYSVFFFVAAKGHDLSNHFVNGSKPFGIIVGHSCAFVPHGTSYCDYVAETVPPTYELGTEFYAVPIIGRASSAGYRLQVVPSEHDTVVKWESSAGTISGTRTITTGEQVMIDNPEAAEAVRITCSKPCVVMMYNPGRTHRQNNGEDTPTDPFQMLVPPVSAFANSSAFSTANFGIKNGNSLNRVDFNNFLAIVTKTSDKDDLLFDGSPIAARDWTDHFNWGYSIAAFSVLHGVHTITRNRGSSACFAGFSYGHSLFTSSSSAYGHTITYQVRGTPITEIWKDSEEYIDEEERKAQSLGCDQERIKSGSAVAQYPNPAAPQVLYHNITLLNKVTSPAQTAACREALRQALTDDLRDTSRDINYKICNRTMAPYVTGSPGSGVPLDVNGQTVNPGLQVVHVAIDTAYVDKAVQIEYEPATGAITMINVTVPYAGILETTTDSFAKARREIRNYLRPFFNWPSSVRRVPQLASCQAVTFNPADEFSLQTAQCSSLDAVPLR